MKITTSVTISDALLTEIDRYAGKDVVRAEFIAIAVRKEKEIGLAAISRTSRIRAVIGVFACGCRGVNG